MFAFIRGWRCVFDPQSVHDIGARKAEYEVTADDVNKFIAVECIPMDDQGRKVLQKYLLGTLLRKFMFLYVQNDTKMLWNKSTTWYAATLC